MWEILVTLLESQRDRIYNPMHTASDTFQALRLFIAYVEPAADIHFFASVFGLEDSAGVEFQVAGQEVEREFFSAGGGQEGYFRAVSRYLDVEGAGFGAAV